MWHVHFSLPLLLSLLPWCESQTTLKPEAACPAQRQDIQDDDGEPLLQAVSLLQRSIQRSSDADMAASRHGMTKKSVNEGTKDFGHPDWLSKCKQIYLDVGTNIGVQIRKFFEPSLYPESPVLPVFTSKFGPPEKRCAPASLSGFCVLGFEPNPRLQPRLQALEEAYNSLGWHVHIYPWAVSGAEGNVTFRAKKKWRIDRDTQVVERIRSGYKSGAGTDWGAKVVDDHRKRRGLEQQDSSKSNLSNVTYDDDVRWGEEAPYDKFQNRWTVRAINLSSFLTSLPGRPSIPLMKMDIEGSEWATLASMEVSGLLCQETIGEAFIETHARGDTSMWDDNRTMDAISRRLARQNCTFGPITINEIDDETYFLDADYCFYKKNCTSGFGKFSSCQVH